MAWVLAAMFGAVPVAGWCQIEEIVVTTRKKEESLQDVPIAVDAITSADIERQGIADLNDIVKASPSVQFDRSFGPSDTRITIRGLSNTRGRSNVAFLVDNIDVTTENLIVAGSGLLANRRLLTDVERIEIVKGPQSALYGRAAFAGAFNYITKEPGDEFDGSVKVDFADDGFQQVDGAFGGPISETLGVRSTAFWYSSDGHYENSISGDDVGGSSGSGGALTAVWRPNDITKVKMRAEYSQEDFDPLPNVRIGGGWQDGQGVGLRLYPEGMLQYARDQLELIAADPAYPYKNALGFNGNNGTSTGILDLNQYCPESLKPQLAGLGPGFCLPDTFGSAKGRVVAHGEDPATGDDFDGTDLETFRFSTIATFDLDEGVVTSLSGWTNFDGSDTYDQDWQAAGFDYRFTPPGGTPTTAQQLPPTVMPYSTTRVPDQLTSGQIANTNSEVEQFSQELRYSSKLDGPVQFDIGALWWDEKRSLYDSNSITACMPLDKIGVISLDGNGNFVYPTFGYEPGVCDGTNNTVVGWQPYWALQRPQTPGYWRAETQHWSFYGTISWEFVENWTLTFEDRYVSEQFNLLKPNQSTCTALGFQAIIGQTFQNDPDVVCPLDKTITPDEQLTNNDSIRPLQGTVNSHFSTPKMTLNWQVTPESLLYFYWAKAQKPGGINALAAGGSAAVLRNENFEPEKLTAWEFGTKNTFEFFGPLLANTAFFLQDYTDKQVTTQVIDDSGISQPRVENASGAEIWGLELEFQWQPEWVEGLSVSLAYTYLDAEYTKFIDNVTSTQRLALANAAGRDCTLVGLNRNPDPNNPDPVVEPYVKGGTYDAIACQVDYSGAKLERTPENAVATAVSYQRPLLDSGLDLLAEVSANWQDKRALDEGNALWFDSYWTVDTRLGLIHPQYEIVAYVDNLFDDDTIKSGGSGPDFGRQVAETAFTAGLGVSHFFGTLPDPRIFGIRVLYRFGDSY
jgi:outer membrane receptor protein involved in Fe transport